MAAAAATAAAAVGPSSLQSSRVWRGAPLAPEFLATNTTEMKKFYGSNFTISQRCWQRIHAKNHLEGLKNSERCLRLAVESGGCHGYMYKFMFDSEPLDLEEDVVFFEDECSAAATTTTTNGDGAAPSSNTSDGHPAMVVVDKNTAGCMEKAVLDYHEELKGSAFVVVGNEKVDHLCACAMSFSVKK